MTIIATCHCTAVRIEAETRPETINDCRCGVCRRYGVRWAYYPIAAVRITAPDGGMDAYAWGDERSLAFCRCGNCGCVTHWRPLGEGGRLAVNANLFEPGDLVGVTVEVTDGP